MADASRHSDAPRAADTTRRLLARAQKGDVQAMNDLFGRHAPDLNRWARGRLPTWARDMADTHDLVQETVLQAFKHVQGFESRGKGALAAYLRQALLNRIRNEIRRVRRRPALEGLDEQAPSPLSSPLQSAILQEQQERYEAGLARLKASDRELIVARLELGLTYEEIAQALGKPSWNAARMAVARAIVRLAGELTPCADEALVQAGRSPWRTAARSVRLERGPNAPTLRSGPHKGLWLDEALVNLAAAVADGAPVDWSAASQTLGSPDELELLEGLKLVADVTRARGVPLPPSRDASGDEEDALQAWGPLRVIERVGRGTFGDVYRAWDTRLEREVALKILHRSESDLPAPGSTAVEEGKLLARVRHPNVVTVYGAERMDGQVGVWMEFVHGKTLEQELGERGPFDVERVVDIAVQLGDALAAVHRAGILHRDVKPHNVMRDQDGRLLLTDFGACELLDAAGSSPADAIGTPLYTAPEVIAGRGATRQSDVYSLGVLLYRLATGGYPVEARTLDEVRTAHAKGTHRPVRAVRGDLPDAVARAIDRAIDPDPARRFGSADALRDAFSTIAHPATSDPPAARAARRKAAVVFAALVAIGGAVAFVRWREPAPLAIAVLPLENLGSDPDDAEFADGLTTELIRHLAMFPGLDVRSRTSSFAFKNQPRNVRDAGRRLQATLLLEGAVQRTGNRIRINAQLVRAPDDATIWAGTFDRDVSAVPAIQDEISRAIVNELRLKLDPRGHPRYDIDVVTYERYLRARSLSARPDRDSLRTAIAFYKDVTATAPGFAPAYAGLADAYADLEFWGINFEDTYSQIEAAASKAIELDPGLPEAHVAMGLVYARDRQWKLAEQAFQRALAINPNLSRSHFAYAHWYLFQMGQLDRALEELQLALTHDPLSLDVRRVMAYVQISAGQYEAALENARYVLKVDPKFPLIRLVRARALLMTGRHAEAIAVLEPMPPNRAPELGYAYAVTGRVTEATALADAASNVPLTQAIIYAGLRDHDRAFAALDRGAAAGDPKIGGVLTYPELRGLREDSRFEAFRRRIGL